MKLFRKLFLIVPVLFSLTACGGNNSPAGTYTFQLGSDTGTHAGISLLLTDDPVETTSSENAKKFQLKFDLGASMSNGIFGLVTHLGDVLTYIQAMADGKIPLPDNIDEIINWVQEKDDTITPSGSTTVDGYYYVATVENAEGRSENRLMMGFEFDFLEDVTDLPPELVEMIMYAVYTGDAVNIVVPVSVEDLLFQLYWYGYRIGGLDVPTYLPDENPMMVAHAIGSHPVKNSDPKLDPVTQIQNYQKLREEEAAEGKRDDYGALEFIYNSYHDYHTLTMGLAKNGTKK